MSSPNKFSDEFKEQVLMRMDELEAGVARLSNAVDRLSVTTNRLSVNVTKDIDDLSASVERLQYKFDVYERVQKTQARVRFAITLVIVAALVTILAPMFPTLALAINALISNR